MKSPALANRRKSATSAASVTAVTNSTPRSDWKALTRGADASSRPTREAARSTADTAASPPRPSPTRRPGRVAGPARRTSDRRSSPMGVVPGRLARVIAGRGEAGTCSTDAAPPARPSWLRPVPAPGRGSPRDCSSGMNTATSSPGAMVLCQLHGVATVGLDPLAALLGNQGRRDDVTGPSRGLERPGQPVTGRPSLVATRDRGTRPELVEHLSQGLPFVGHRATTRAGSRPSSATAMTIVSLWTSRPTNFVVLQSAMDQSSRCWLCPRTPKRPG